MVVSLLFAAVLSVFALFIEAPIETYAATTMATKAKCPGLAPQGSVVKCGDDIYVLIDGTLRQFSPDGYKRAGYPAFRVVDCDAVNRCTRGPIVHTAAHVKAIKNFLPKKQCFPPGTILRCGMDIFLSTPDQGMRQFSPEGYSAAGTPPITAQRDQCPTDCVRGPDIYPADIDALRQYLPTPAPMPTPVITSGGTPLRVEDMITTNSAVVGPNELRVTYPARRWSTSGGINKAIGISPRESITLSYSVMFEPGWCWGGTSKGGKIPGVWFGEAGATGGSGGSWEPDAGTYRPMWYGDGQPCAYVYYVKASNTDESRRSFGEQDPAFSSIATASGTAGQQLWRKAQIIPNFPVGQWISVVVGMRLNTPGQRDGSITLSVNGVTRTYDKMYWRSTSTQLIRKVVIASWLGGSGPEWTCPTTQYARFKDFVVA